MGATLSRLPGGTPDARTVKELVVIEELIRTDLGAAQRDQEQYMPMRAHGNNVVEESSEVPSPTTPDRTVDAADAQEPYMMADAPANEAFQRYQQSAAAAAADQGTAEPAVSQATPPDVRSKGGSKRQKMDCEGTALGNSYRSRKRKEKEAASQAASHKSNLGKRLRRELEMLHDHVPDVSADASGPCASAGKRHKAISGTPVQKTKMRAFTPGKKSSKPKSADWEYMGPDLTDADVSQDDWVRCPDGRSYPKSMTYKEDDIFVDEYLGKVDDDQLYTVAYIIDERRQGNKREFRVKWEGFEMNPEEWIPYTLIKDVAELDKWEEKLGLAQ